MRKLPKARKLNSTEMSYGAFLVGSVALFAPVLGLVYAADRKKTGYTEPSGGPSDVGDIENPLTCGDDLAACKKELKGAAVATTTMSILAGVLAAVAGVSILVNYLQATDQ